MLNKNLTRYASTIVSKNVKSLLRPPFDVGGYCFPLDYVAVTFFFTACFLRVFHLGDFHRREGWEQGLGSKNLGAD